MKLDSSFRFVHWIAFNAHPIRLTFSALTKYGFASSSFHLSGLLLAFSLVESNFVPQYSSGSFRLRPR
jgi:hypothetical protein